MTQLDLAGRMLWWRWELRNRQERLVRAFVWRLPHQVVMWAFYRVCGNATSGPFGNEHPDSLTWHTAIDRWCRHEGGDPAFRRGS